jgi:hypothetical protein
MTVYAVGLIYNDEWEGEVIQIYQLWSDYKKAKEAALKIQLRQVGAIVVQSFIVDSPNSLSEPEVIKEHERFLRYGS